MGFPWLLLGGLAAGIPVALHFFFRSRYRVVPWAAMEYLLTSSDRAEWIGPGTSTDHKAAADLVNGIRLSSLSTDFHAGFVEAARALHPDRVHNSRREVYLFSDMQTSGWQRQGAAVRAQA